MGGLLGSRTTLLVAPGTWAGAGLSCAWAVAGWARPVSYTLGPEAGLGLRPVADT